jgi:hypothetical protein
MPEGGIPTVVVMPINPEIDPETADTPPLLRMGNENAPSDFPTCSCFRSAVRIRILSLSMRTQLLKVNK